MRGDDDAGIRHVPVCEWAAGPLRDWLAAHPVIRKGFVAHEPDGNPVSHRTFVYNLNRTQERLWDERRFTGHDFRHFYVSQLLAAGVPLVPDVQRYIGHVPGSPITARTYAHLIPGADQRARDAIDAAFGVATR
jgi:integrase